MSGIVFFRTERREDVIDFYLDRLGFERWLQQDAGCTILRYDNALIGFCDGKEADKGGITTVVVDDDRAVDAVYTDLRDVATGKPTMNEDFDIYQFFLEDPEGRTVEIQSFQHSVPPVEDTQR